MLTAQEWVLYHILSGRRIHAMGVYMNGRRFVGVGTSSSWFCYHRPRFWYPLEHGGSAMCAFARQLLTIPIISLI